jgi:dolichol-phosphate mannosyltransferase
MDNIVSQSNKLLQMSIKFGFALASFSALYALYIVIKYFMTDEVVPGWTSVMVSIYFIGGLLFANLGLIGLYIGKIFDETKNRPLYVIDEII